MRASWKALGVAVLVWGVAGCASRAARVPVIEESWLARVPQERLEPVYQARTEFRRSEDGVTRAKVSLTDARNQARVAAAQLEAARREVDVARANLDLAKEQGQRPAQDRAERQGDIAHLALETAELRRGLAEARVEAAEAALDVEQANVEAARVNLSRTQYTVLALEGDTRVDAYDRAEFDEAQAVVERDEARARKKLGERLRKVELAQQRFENAQSRLQAVRAGSPDIG